MAKINKNVPCYGCERRSPQCHGSCEDYKAYAQERADRAEIIRKKRADEAMVDAVRFQTIKKVSNKANKQTAWKG